MSDINMSVNIAGVELKNPVTVASVVFGSAWSITKWEDFSMFLYTDWEMLNRQRTLYGNRE